MSEVVIRADKLGKRYRIAGPAPRYKTLRDSLAGAAAAPARWARRLVSSTSHGDSGADTFWALKDVSFEVRRGEVLGVIGRNGAGKSTLLKILSRITEPTEGWADLCGRVGSLLEVGTGFHPELSGRDNVYLNGAILGMRKAEIDRRFDEIVAFAEVERFIDTQVKHYSSGMYLRLAFAVAAHLETEILFVDEVLAVGDAAFQRRCLNKMSSLSRDGRTVLFISHNMEAVLGLCSGLSVIEAGRLVVAESVESGVTGYLRSLSGGKEPARAHVVFNPVSPDDSSQIRVLSVETLDPEGRPKPTLYTWDDVAFRLTYISDQFIENGSFVLDIWDHKQQRLVVFDSGSRVPILAGQHTVECLVPRLPLSAGEYFLGAGLSVSRMQWLWRETCLGSLSVHGRDVYELGRAPVAARMLFAAEYHWRPVAGGAPGAATHGA